MRSTQPPPSFGGGAGGEATPAPFKPKAARVCHSRTRRFFPAWALLLLVFPARALAWEPPSRAEVLSHLGQESPREWGERVAGVRTRVKTDEKVLALTFDLCGGPKGSGLDEELVAFLEREKIPATFFVSHRWAQANPERLARLAKNPLFEIENHGWDHRPASVTGRSAYGIQGTGSVGELYDEIEKNAEDLARRTGRRPRFYRSGTGFTDEVAVKVAAELGQELAGASLLGDAGATFSASQVRDALLAARPGDIAILHANHPESGTGQGVREAVPVLKAKGYRFIGVLDSELE